MILEDSLHEMEPTLFQPQYGFLLLSIQFVIALVHFGHKNTIHSFVRTKKLKHAIFEG